MNVFDEKQVIKRARKDPEAFGLIFDRYYDVIFAYVLKRVGNVHASQDIVSDTFYKALHKLWQFKWQNISISSWFYRIATNEMNQYFRKQKRNICSADDVFEKNSIQFQNQISILEEILEQEQELARAKQWQYIRKCMEKLPKKYQEVLALKYLEGKKIKEISAILGKKEGTIKSLLSRAMMKLKKQCNQESIHALYVGGRKTGRTSS